MRTAWAIVGMIVGVVGCQPNPYAEAAREYDEAERSAIAAGLPVTPAELEFLPEKSRDAKTFIERIKVERKPEDAPLTTAYFARNAEALKQIEQLAASTELTLPVKFQDDVLLASFGFAYYAKLKEFAKLLVERATWNDRQGAFAETLKDLSRIDRLASILDSDPDYTAGMVAIAIDGIQREAVLEIAQSASRAERIQLKAAVRSVPRLKPERLVAMKVVETVDMARNLERLGGWNNFRAVLTEEEVPESARKEPPPIPRLNSGPPRTDRERAFAARALQRATKLITDLKSAGDGREQLTIFRKDDEAARTTPAEEFMQLMPWLLPDMHLASLGGESRAELTKAYLELLINPSAPKMPVDPLTGQPFRFQRTPKGFRVWGAGRDLVDNGGVPRPESSEGYEGWDDLLEFPRSTGNRN